MAVLHRLQAFEFSEPAGCIPLAQIDKSLDALAGSRYFNTLDLISRHCQVPLDKDGLSPPDLGSGNGKCFFLA